MEDGVAKALADAAEELRNIHRGKHYGFWREETAPKIDAVFREAEPNHDEETCCWEEPVNALRRKRERASEDFPVAERVFRVHAACGHTLAC